MKDIYYRKKKRIIFAIVEEQKRSADLIQHHAWCDRFLLGKFWR
jgi:hypothetical protein